MFNKIRASLLLLLLIHMSCNGGKDSSWNPLTEPAKIVAGGMIDSSKNFKDAADLTSERIEKSADKISEALPKASSGFGENAVTTIRNGLGIAAGIYIVGKSVIGIKDYFYPSIDSKAHEMECKERIEASEKRILEHQKEKECLMCEKMLKECLMKNFHTSKTESGRPIVCEDAALKFVAASGGDGDALDKVIKALNRHFKE